MPTVEPYPQPLTDQLGDPKDKLSRSGFPFLILAKDVNDHPDVKRPELVLMEKWWKLGDILLGGIDTVRAHAQEVLPALGDDEDATEREARIRKAIATPFYADTIDRLVSRPFGRAIRFETDADLPPQLQHLVKNADGRGKSLTAMLRDHMHDAIHRSGDCLLVDLPSQALPTSRGEQLRARPVIKPISLRDILGWDWTSNDDGTITTTGLRLHEVNTRKTGLWKTDTVQGVRIIVAAKPEQNGEAAEPGFSLLYEKNERGDWVLVSDEPFNQTRIRLHTTWTNQKTATSGKSPMTYLAELNMAFIMGDCEQQYGASYARISTTYTTGADEKEEAGGKLGANVTGLSPVRTRPKRVTRGNKRHIKLPQEATVGLLESSGSGLAAGKAELDAQENRMAKFGSSHWSTPGVTATQIQSDDGRETSNLRSWTGRVEDTATAAIQDAAELAEVQLPAKFRVCLYRDWAAAIEREQAAPHVFSSFDRKLVPARTVHDLLRRYGAIGEHDTTQKLLAEARAEAAELGEQEAAAALARALAEGGVQDPDDPAGKKPPPGAPPAVPPKPGQGDT